MRIARRESALARQARSSDIAYVLSREGDGALEVEVDSWTEAVSSVHNATSKILQSDQIVSMLIYTGGKYVELHMEVCNAIQLLERTTAECLSRA